MLDPELKLLEDAGKLAGLGGARRVDRSGMELGAVVEVMAPMAPWVEEMFGREGGSLGGEVDLPARSIDFIRALEASSSKG